jgi:plastocyanin
MIKYILFFLIFLCLLTIEDAAAQKTSELSGRVFMPTISKEQRKFRGRIYRNRLSSGKRTKNSNQALKSSFIDIIVSAHPVHSDTLPEPKNPVTIIQVNAEFVPRVVAITPGTQVRFINRDRFFHNVFSITPGSRFNIGRKPTGVSVGQTINKLGETKIFCDIHAQMNATIICLDTPYYTRVGPDGRYRLTGLPEGTYDIQIYHPDLPGIEETIDVAAGESISRNYTISR